MVGGQKTAAGSKPSFRDRAQRTFFFICEARALFPFFSRRFPPIPFPCVPPPLRVLILVYPLNVYNAHAHIYIYIYYFWPIEKRAGRDFPATNDPFATEAAELCTRSAYAHYIILYSHAHNIFIIIISNPFARLSVRGVITDEICPPSPRPATLLQGSSPKGSGGRACNSIRVGTRHVSHCDFHTPAAVISQKKKNLLRPTVKLLRFHPYNIPTQHNMLTRLRCGPAYL